eukprot:NODE_107_length_1553_cov_529.258766_g105_i0.p1 GENE.NODE_107_length_1553_cov_529.258766_g105_i0~~NODE_107_length_1553_cov_529.258766_g105_i0.p1  ORF type:complete len:125 (-),score=30.37 NODE_107_length_1553_cov_529.258766_g105_i0:392-766(-)
MYMWGDNSYGQLGDGTTRERTTPTKITLPNQQTCSHLALGMEHSGCVTVSKQLFMWGCNHYGQLGDGTAAGQDTPIQITTFAFQPAECSSLSLGGYHSGCHVPHPSSSPVSVHQHNSITVLSDW